MIPPRRAPPLPARPARRARSRRAGRRAGDERAPRPPAQRVAFLRAARELLLRDLGGFVYEIHRTAGDHEHEAHRRLRATKLARLSRIDAELHELELRLDDVRRHVVVREPGVGGECPQCGELFGSDAHYCSHCGAAADRERPPRVRAASSRRRPPRAETAARGRSRGAPPDQPTQPSSRWPRRADDGVRIGRRGRGGRGRGRDRDGRRRSAHGASTTATRDDGARASRDGATTPGDDGGATRPRAGDDATTAGRQHARRRRGGDGADAPAPESDATRRRTGAGGESANGRDPAGSTAPWSART